jgi:hypothetical protein
VTIGKAQGLVTGGGETEQAVGPVVNAQNAFFKKCTHLICLGYGRDKEPKATKGMLKACYSCSWLKHKKSHCRETVRIFM